MNKPVRFNPSTPPDRTDDDVVKKYKELDSCRLVGEHFGISKARVSQILARAASPSFVKKVPHLRRAKK